MKTIKPNAAAMFLALIFFSLNTMAQSITSDAIIGTYKNKNNSTEVQVYKKNNAYFGIVVSGNEKLATGTIILKDFIYSANKWKGQVFAPARSSDFVCIITMPNQDKLKLSVKAGLVSREQEWTKIK